MLNKQKQVTDRKEISPKFLSDHTVTCVLSDSFVKHQLSQVLMSHQMTREAPKPHCLVLHEIHIPTSAIEVGLGLHTDIF